VREHHSPSRTGSETIAKGSGSTAMGEAPFKPGPPQKVPREVKVSFLLWLTAVAAGVIETIVRVIYSLFVSSGSGGGADVTGVAIRVIIYIVVVYIIMQMRLGKRWARLAVAVLLGGIGTLSLVIDPILWLAGGNSVSEVFTEADLLFFIIAPIRVVHFAAVVTALVFMFLPSANTYFRRTSSVAGAPGSSTVV
jgi:Na+/H+ antiporter NhaA